MRFLTVLVLTGALAIVGCGDDETNGTGGSGGDGATGGGTAGTGGGTGGVGGGTGGTGGGGGMNGGSADAKAFCTRYEPTCGFGTSERYEDEDDCIAMYDSFSGPKTDTDSKQYCVEEHLTNAEGTMPDFHCPHATGETICDLD
jgi:hypothetical protein